MGIGFTVQGAHHPSSRGNADGCNHIVVSEEVHKGRLLSKPGDPLCRPASDFWGLTGPEDRPVNCQRCALMGMRLGVAFTGTMLLRVAGWRWACLRIAEGKPVAVDLYSYGKTIPPGPQAVTEGLQAFLKGYRVDHVPEQHFEEDRCGWISTPEVIPCR